MAVRLLMLIEVFEASMNDNDNDDDDDDGDIQL
jgi:hypothetical protein